MRIGSLFSGYGGLDMAVESVFPGASPAWFCEWDDAPARILAHHWPDVPNLRDVTAVDWSAVEPVDILAGGFPCQDVSHAGRRQGLIRDGDGKTRSGLWGEMLKAIDTIRPSLVVAENVRGLLSAEADSDVEPCPFCMGDGGASPMRALGAVLADLADIGYDAAWCGLRAADVGAPHGRFRVFILAWPTADTNGPSGEAQLGRPGAGDPGRREPLGSRDPDSPLKLLPTPTATDSMPGQDPEDRKARGYGAFLSDLPKLLPTPRASDPANTSSHSSEGFRPQLGEVARKLLPTPLANDFSDDISTTEERQARGYGNHLRDLPLMLPGAGPLLPTPQARDYKDHQVQVAGHRPEDKDSINRAIAHLLPTPRTSDTNGPGVHGTGGQDLRTVIDLLPTPDAAMGERGPRSESALAAGNRQTNLNDLPRLTWGDYAPAIARWESVLGRPAPAPTEPGPKGNPRLSPLFVEWLMGLPAGHVTDPAIGLTRNQQLKALGNGVVPAQGAAALERLLSVKAVAE